MRHQLILSSAIKKITCMVLIFVATMLYSKVSIAQPGDAIDSLITIKKDFKKNDEIEFIVKLDKRLKTKPYHVRQVETMSCACNDKDFYYEVYTIANTKYPSNRKSFLIHNEKPNANKCACKTHYAEFYDSKKYFIPALSKSGKYVLIIRGFGFVMYSNVFIVTD